MKKLLLLIIFLSCWTLLPAQLSYGTTGLLHAPSADMQKDKTVMLGGNFLHQELTPPKFNFNTWNYYLNVTIFPFLEVAYTCTLFTAGALDWISMAIPDSRTKIVISPPAYVC